MKLLAYFNMVPLRRHPFLFFILSLMFISKVFCSDCGSVSLIQVKAVNETQNDVILWNVGYSVTNINWTMTPATSGVDPQRARQLEDYIKLNYSDSFLHIGLDKPLDKEELYSNFNVDVESVILQMTCSTPGQQIVKTNITLAITAVNEFAPHIFGGPYNITVKEDTTVGSTVFKVNVSDPDVPKTPLIYELKSSTASTLRSANFSFPQPSDPDLKLIKAVDYDTLVSSGIPPIFHFVLNVTDGGGDGLHNQTNISIEIQDVDDLPPVFLYPDCGRKCVSTQFRLETSRTHRGLVRISPMPLKAVDQDSLNYSIIYSILKDQNGYHSSFAIDSRSGVISQVMDVNQTGIISVKAEEISTNKHSTVAVVLVEFSEKSSNQPITEQAASNNGFLIGIIVLAIMAAALISVIAILVILHRKLKKQVEPFDSDKATAKEVETKLHVPKISEVNEVKPIPRTTKISEDSEFRDSKEKTLQDEKIASNNATELINQDTISSLPTPSKRKNLLDPIESTETLKKKKKKKKKKDLLRKLGEEKHIMESEISEETLKSKEKRQVHSEMTEESSMHREDGTTQTVIDKVKGPTEQHQMEVIDGRFVRPKDEIFV